jgi:hypothetical protein
MLQAKAHELSKPQCELQAATSPGSPSGGAAPRAMTCQRSPLVTLYAESVYLPMWQDMTVHCGIPWCVIPQWVCTSGVCQSQVVSGQCTCRAWHIGCQVAFQGPWWVSQ